MADIATATGGGAAVVGLSLFGVSTGLDPALLIAGFAGAAWAQSYSPSKTYLQRLILTLLGAVLAGYFAPVASTLIAASDTVRGALPGKALQLPVAVLVGLLVHSVLGPAIMRIVRKKSEDLAK